MKISTFIVAAFLLAASSLRASDVFIVLDIDTISLPPGATFTFPGGIVNNDQSTVDLNGIDITLDGSLFQVDTSPFFFGPISLAANQGTTSLPLFSVTVDLPYNVPPGIQNGTLTILGGVEVNNVYDPTVQDVLGSVPFSVDVVTPEPSTFAMFSAAILAGIGFLLHKRRKLVAPSHKEMNVTTLTVLPILLALAAVDAHANLLTNGSFDIPPAPAGSFNDYNPGDTGLTGWTIAGNPGTDVSTISTMTVFNGFSYVAEDGPNSLDLTGDGSNNDTEGVAQTIATNIGDFYTLTFWIGNVDNPLNLQGAASTVDVSANGTPLGAFTNMCTACTTTQSWQLFTTSFIATSNSTALQFLNGDPLGDNSNGLDNVSVVDNGLGIPEPATLVSVLTGLALFSASIRRCRQ